MTVFGNRLVAVIRTLEVLIILLLQYEMKSHIILFPIIFLISIILSTAQVDTLSFQTNHKIIFSISAGLAIPIGKFSYFKTDFNSFTENIAGHASLGFNGKFDMTYLFSKDLGFICMLYSSVNKAEIPDSVDLFPPPYSPPALGGGSRMLSYKYTTKTWYINGVLAGPVVMIENDNMNFTFRLTGGIQQVQSPETRLDEKGYNWQIDWPAVHPYTLFATSTLPKAGRALVNDQQCNKKI
jgi:hypothetical protein